MMKCPICNKNKTIKINVEYCESTFGHFAKYHDGSVFCKINGEMYCYPPTENNRLYGFKEFELENDLIDYVKRVYELIHYL